MSKITTTLSRLLSNSRTKIESPISSPKQRSKYLKLKNSFIKGGYDLDVSIVGYEKVQKVSRFISHLFPRIKKNTSLTRCKSKPLLGITAWRRDIVISERSTRS